MKGRVGCENTGNLLKIIWRPYICSASITLCRSIDIANELSFSKPSVSVAMKNLRENGYIHMDDQGHITLTQTGQDIADKMYERHIMLSNWLIYLGVDEKTAVEDACKIEHVLSSQSFQAIKKHITQGNELPADMKEEE